jgi:hypothetical protein
MQVRGILPSCATLYCICRTIFWQADKAVQMDQYKWTNALVTYTSGRVFSLAVHKIIAQADCSIGRSAGILRLERGRSERQAQVERRHREIFQIKFRSGVNPTTCGSIHLVNALRPYEDHRLLCRQSLAFGAVLWVLLAGSLLISCPAEAAVKDCLATAVRFLAQLVSHR